MRIVGPTRTDARLKLNRRRDPRAIPPEFRDSVAPVCCIRVAPGACAGGKGGLCNGDGKGQSGNCETYCGGTSRIVSQPMLGGGTASFVVAVMPPEFIQWPAGILLMLCRLPLESA
jgi:hypothetical protein